MKNSFIHFEDSNVLVREDEIAMVSKYDGGYDDNTYNVVLRNGTTFMVNGDYEFFKRILIDCDEVVNVKGHVF